LPAKLDLGIDTIDPTYYTVAHGDRQTMAPSEADVDLGRDTDLPRTVAHPFYTRLNRILDNADFDGYVESVCQRFYANEIGRPAPPAGRYFRLLLIGCVEGLDAERAIASRAADSRTGRDGRPRR
jgi:hypothetical protein